MLHLAKQMNVPEFKRIILLGDSITQYSFNGGGWGQIIADLVQRKCDILNRGFSGYTTAYIIKILDELLDKRLVQNVAAVTIFFGANDSGLLELNPRQHVPLDKYEKNLEVIVEHFQTLGVKSNQIILISAPVVDEKAWLEHMIEKGRGTQSDRSNEVVGKYASACQRVAQSRHCRFIDLWTQMMASENSSSLLCDGLHLSAAGNSFLGKLLEPHIVELTENLPIIFPLWDQFPLEGL